MSWADREGGYYEGWYTAFPIESSALFDYIVPTIVFREIKKGITSFKTYPMRRCRVEDFESKGYFFKSETDKELATYRFCPDIENIEYLSLMNAYSNNFERMSFSMEFHTCLRTLGSSCQPAPNVKKMLDVAMFNIFILSEAAELGNTDNYEKTPLITRDTFHS
jgi:hypothetical protein